MGLKVFWEEAGRAFNFYPDHTLVAHNILDTIGGNKVLAHAYAGTLLLFTVCLVVEILLNALRGMQGVLTYADVFALLLMLLGTIVVGVLLWRVGRAAWGRRERAVALKMLASCVTVAAVLGGSFALHTSLWLVGPTYCSRYVEPMGQPGALHCFTQSSRPLNPALTSTCTHYYTQADSSQYQALEPLCQAGDQPSPRPTR